MAEEFLEEIYIFGKMQMHLENCVSSAYRVQDQLAMNSWDSYAELLTKLTENMLPSDKSLLPLLYRSSQEVAALFSDLSRFGGEIERVLLPLLRGILSQWEKIDLVEGDYHFVSTPMGFLTLEYRPYGKYLHSIYDPMKEAFSLAEELYDPLQDEFRVFGCGLGYLPYAVWELSNKSLPITIYESNPLMLEYSKAYGVLSWIDESFITVLFEEDPEKLVMKFVDEKEEEKEKKNIGFYISPWAIELYKDDFERYEDLKEIQMDLNHIGNFKGLFQRNEHLDRRKAVGGAHELEETLSGSEWVVVAAGPSLDENMDYLRESIGVRKVVAVNTCIGKLKKYGIKPDLFVALDPSAGMKDHIIGKEDFTAGIPLVAERRVYWEFVDRYQGPVYLCYSSSTPPDKEAGPEPDSRDLWLLGSTVATLAIQTAIHFGAKKIYLIGLDLGYPGGKKYANDMPYHLSESLHGCEEARATDGGIVATERVFNIFRRDVELLISKNPSIQFVNMSKNGAYIQGTFSGKWWEENDGLSVDGAKEYLRHLCEETILNWEQKYYLLQALYASPGMKQQVAAEPKLEEAFGEAFHSIYKEFRPEFDWTPDTDGEIEKNFVYVLTDCFHGTEHEDAKDTMHRLYGLEVARKKILFVNTAERFSGEYTATSHAPRWEYPKDLANEDKIFHNGKKYPYYQFPEGMPSLAFMKEFLIFTKRHRPEKVINLCRFSLLSRLLAEFLQVENFIIS